MIEITRQLKKERKGRRKKGKIKNLINKSLISVVILVTIYGLSHSFTVVEAAEEVNNDSSIAGVLLEGLTYDEAKEKLINEVKKWQEKEPLLVESENEKLTIPRTIFQFDIDASIAELEKKTERHWALFFLKPKTVQLPLNLTIDYQNSSVENWPDYIDIEETLKNLKQVASNLGDDISQIIYKEDASYKRETVAEVVFTIPDISETVTKYIVNEINGQAIYSESQFSFINSVGLPTDLYDYSDETSFIATTLYALFLKTNFEVIERNSQGVIPLYSEPGIEAKLSYGEKKDLIFYNPNNYSFILSAKISGNKLEMSLDAQPFETTYEYRFENKVEIDPRIIYRYSNDLKPGEQETMAAGEKGIRIDVYRVNLFSDGEIENEELISQDFYPPLPKIILVSSKESIPEESLTKVVENAEKSLGSDSIESGENIDSVLDEMDAEGLASGDEGEWIQIRKDTFENLNLILKYLIEKYELNEEDEMDGSEGKTESSEEVKGEK